MLSMGSDPLDDGGGAHAGADAERHERRAEAAPLELVEDGAEDHRSGRAERMAHRDRAAIDVDLLRVELEEFSIEEDDRGESLVDLEEVDVARPHAGALQKLARH